MTPIAVNAGELSRLLKLRDQSRESVAYELAAIVSRLLQAHGAGVLSQPEYDRGAEKIATALIEEGWV